MTTDLSRPTSARLLWTVLLMAFGCSFTVGCGGSEPEPAPEVQAVEQEQLDDQLQAIEQQEG
ncbi:MAG: hypothetical protein ACF8PG_10135 [Maioricimonas sp. JB045]|uniref:hypothetical protein n=1 Tax=Maioricimonas sp. JC845 TaxID=3232138 RepID=UPI00345835C5